MKFVHEIMIQGMVALGLLACGGPKKPGEAPDGGDGSGVSMNDPVMTCGPDDSYAYLAKRFECPDGSNPFAGDSRRAAQSRLGSSESPVTKHFVDLYEVPCQGGPVRVYVDMYGCPEYEQRLSAEESAEARELTGRFMNGEFQWVLERCDSLGPGSQPDERAWCTAFTPASLHAQKRDAEAIDYNGRHCAALPPASADSDARAAHLLMVMMALAELAQKGHFTASDEEREALLTSWLRVCQVTEEQLNEVVDKVKRSEH